MDLNLEEMGKKKLPYEYAGKIKVKKNETNLSLYKHQQEAIQQLNKKITNAAQSFFSGLLVLPTGGGKTLTAAYWLLKNYIDKSKKVLWIAHRHELLDQAKETFQNIAYSDILKNKTSFNYRVISGIHDKPANIKSNDDLIIASKDSLNSGLEHLYNNWIKNNNEEIFLIIDEAHHATAKTYRKIIDNLREKVKNLKILGLTATPTRTAENEKGLLKKIFPDDIVYKTDLRTLINRGILSEPVFEEIKTEIDMTEILNEKEIDNLKYFDIDSLGTATAKTIAENAGRNNRIVDHYVKNRSKYKQTLVFSLNIDNAIALKTIFIDKGIKSDYVVSTLKDTSAGSGISPKENKARIKSFRRGDLDVLINVNILTEGIDVPNVQTVFLTRPTISTILMSQMIGRGLRGEKAGGTKEAYIVSFIDDWKDKISWINPEKLLIQENTDFTDRTNERDKKVLRLVSIEKIEEFAKMMDRTIDTKALEELEFIQRIPVGIYSFSILKAFSDEDREKNCEILVYDNIKEAYEELIVSLPDFFTENNLLEKDSFTEKELETFYNKVDEEFFYGCEKLPGYLREDIKDLLAYYAQKEETPQFIELKDREKYDITKIANEIYEQDYGEKRKKEYLDKIWNDEEIAWKTFFGFDERYFRNEIDIAIRKISRPDLFKTSDKKSVEEKELRELEKFSMSELYEKYPEYWRKLRDSVYKKYKDKDGHYTCAVSGFKSKNKRHFQINHITPMSDGGLTVPDNLQLLGKKDCLLKRENSFDNDSDWNNIYFEGLALEDEGKYEEAIKYYDKALEINPVDIFSLKNKQQCLDKLEKIQETKKYKKSPLTEFPALTVQEKYEKTINYYKKAKNFIKLEKYKEAIKCYDKTIKLNPENSNHWSNKANALEKLKKYEEALKCYDKAIEVKPYEDIYWHNKAYVLEKLEKYEEAIKCYNKAIELNPYEDIYWRNKAYVLEKLKKYEEAIKCYDKAIELNPEDDEDWKNKGNVLEKLEKYEEALKCYDKAIELNPDYDFYWFIKGKISIKLKKYEEALKCYDKAIEFNPENSNYWTNKAYALKKLEKYEEAINCYDKSIEIWNKKGLKLYNQDKYEEAIRCYDKAIEIDSKNYKVWNNKGKVLRKQGKIKEAIRCYDKALEIKPDYKESLHNKEDAKSFIEMVYINGGTFKMGSNNGNYDEKPVHSVTVSSFYLGKYPVTNKEYCLYKTSHENLGDNLPVVYVSWEDAIAYCKWLSRNTGSNYRLPTEAEWEYACRAKTTTDYYWGNAMDDSYCWYKDNSENKIHPVGQKLPNSFGLYDMSGTVWEWCSDWYGNYPSGMVSNPTGPKSGSCHVLRGGSWSGSAGGCRSALRSYYSPDYRFHNVGFRLVCNSDINEVCL